MSYKKQIILIGILLSAVIFWGGARDITAKKTGKSAAEKFSREELKKMLIPIEVMQSYENRYARSNYHRGNLDLKVVDTPLPEGFDWRDFGIVSPVKNQGRGACWVFSAISVMESQVIKFAGGTVDLSEKEISCCHPLGESGGTSSLAFAYILEKGIVKEERYPWVNQVGQECSAPAPPDYYLNDYGILYLGFKPLAERVKIIKSHLVTHGPLCVGFTVYDDFSDFYRGSVYIWNGNNKTVGGHAVNLIGWQDDSNIPNGGYWICKNSWGEDWADDGFFKIGYGQVGIDDIIIWAHWNPDQTSPIFKIKVGIRYAGIGHLVDLDIAARSNHGAAISYSAENLPAGANYDSQTGAFTWTPTGSQAGIHVITFIADDGSEQTRQQGTFIIKDYSGQD